MMVVSNTSPLTNLATIGQFGLLRQQFGTLHIAEGVFEELHFDDQLWPGYREVEQADWIQRHRVQNTALVTALRHDLDKGEAETIALAIERQAGLVLLDETDGRHQAQRFNLPLMGTVGILLRAKQLGQITEAKPLLHALRYNAGFYLSDSLFQQVLKAAGED